MAEYKLYRWCVWCDQSDPYQAPETVPFCLVGFRDQEAKRIITSPIKSVDGRKITTMSGSIYHLEDIDPAYLQWIHDNGFNYNPDDPFKRK